MSTDRYTLTDWWRETRRAVARGLRTVADRIEPRTLGAWWDSREAKFVWLDGEEVKLTLPADFAMFVGIASERKA